MPIDLILLIALPDLGDAVFLNAAATTETAGNEETLKLVKLLKGLRLVRLLKLLRLFKIGKFLNTLRDEFEVTPHAANPNPQTQTQPPTHTQPQPQPQALTLDPHPDHSP